MFLITAMDGTDAEALSRRMATRPAHFERVQGEAASGRLRIGGAILDDSGTMIGSMLILDVPTREAAQAWLDADPYTKAGVWRSFTIVPARIADLPYATAKAA